MKRAHKRTNCLLSELGPSEPDEDYALYGLGVQEGFVKAFLLGCLCHGLLKMNNSGERYMQKQQVPHQLGRRASQDRQAR